MEAAARGARLTPGPDDPGGYWYEQAMVARSAQHVLLQAGEQASLRRRGLPDPVRELRASLSTCGALLATGAGIDGLDRDARFRPETIAPLNGRWAFARFEDGRGGGSCLLEYLVLRGGRVRWRLLAVERGPAGPEDPVPPPPWRPGWPGR